MDPRIRCAVRLQHSLPSFCQKTRKYLMLHLANVYCSNDVVVVANVVFSSDDYEEPLPSGSYVKIEGKLSQGDAGGFVTINVISFLQPDWAPPLLSECEVSITGCISSKFHLGRECLVVRVQPEVPGSGVRFGLLAADVGWPLYGSLKENEVIQAFGTFSDVLPDELDGLPALPLLCVRPKTLMLPERVQGEAHTYGGTVSRSRDQRDLAEEETGLSDASEVSAMLVERSYLRSILCSVKHCSDHESSDEDESISMSRQSMPLSIPGPGTEDPVGIDSRIQPSASDLASGQLLSTSTTNDDTQWEKSAPSTSSSSMDDASSPSVSLKSSNGDGTGAENLSPKPMPRPKDPNIDIQGAVRGDVAEPPNVGPLSTFGDGLGELASLGRLSPQPEPVAELNPQSTPETEVMPQASVHIEGPRPQENDTSPSVLPQGSTVRVRGKRTSQGNAKADTVFWRHRIR